MLQEYVYFYMYHVYIHFHCRNSLLNHYKRESELRWNFDLILFFCRKCKSVNTSDVSMNEFIANVYACFQVTYLCFCGPCVQTKQIQNMKCHYQISNEYRIRIKMKKIIYIIQIISTIQAYLNVYEKAQRMCAFGLYLRLAHG